MRKKFLTAALIFFTIFTFSGMCFAQTADPSQANAEKFGLLTLLPPVIAILLAFLTKNVVLSLFLGIFSGTFLISLNNHNFIESILFGFISIVNNVLTSLANPWNAGIVLQCLTIGGMIALVSKMGGAKAVAEALAKKAKTPTSAQLITWLLGIFVFFDDYANSLIVGPIMRPVTDKMKISREKLSFIVDATAAPIAGIALISTWVGYEIGLIKEAYAGIGQSVNAYGIFMSTIPYRFYNILILLFIVATAIFLREFGPMYKAEKRARTTGKLTEDNAVPMVSEEATHMEPKEGIRLSIWNAIIPIGTLMVAAFVGFYFNGLSALSDNAEVMSIIKSHPLSLTAIRETFGASDASIVLFQAALIASVVAIVMGVLQKIFTLSEAIDTWVLGIKSMVITGVILLLAWSLSSVIKDLGTAKYLVSILASAIPKAFLPAMIFIFGAVISFATGTSYGTMGILMPLAVPLAHAISPDPNYTIIAAGSVLTGAIFGDHCSPISDTTILSSMGSACDHIDHVKTQLYYSLVVAFIAVVFGYIPVSIGIPIYFVLPVDIVMIFLVVRFFGKSVKDFEINKIEEKVKKAI